MAAALAPALHEIFHKYAGLALTVGRFQVPVTHVARGWVNTSAVTTSPKITAGRVILR